jgi:hypothetical protein
MHPEKRKWIADDMADIRTKHQTEATQYPNDGNQAQTDKRLKHNVEDFRLSHQTTVKKC